MNKYRKLITLTIIVLLVPLVLVALSNNTFAQAPNPGAVSTLEVEQLDMTSGTDCIQFGVNTTYLGCDETRICMLRREANGRYLAVPNDYNFYSSAPERCDRCYAVGETVGTVNTADGVAYKVCGLGNVQYYKDEAGFDRERYFPTLTVESTNIPPVTGVNCGADVTNEGTCPAECPATPEFDDNGDISRVICKRPDPGTTPTTPGGSASAPNILTAYGSACTQQYALCTNSPGTKNLVEAIRSGDMNVNVGWEMTSTNVLGDLRAEFGSDLNNVCIKENITGFVPIKTAWLRGPDKEKVITHYGNNETYLRACTEGFFPSEVPVAGTGFLNQITGGWRITGCCKQGYQLVTIEDTLSGSGVEYQNTGVCCSIPPGANSASENYPYKTTTGFNCVNKQGADLTAAGISQPDPDKATIEGVDVGLGSNQYEIDKSSPPLLCGPQDKCVVTGKNAEGIAIVSDPELLKTNRTLACYRCYGNGEAIQVDSKSKKLYLCDNGKLKSEDLINDSVAITLSYLRELEVNGPENADNLKSCTNAGGIYTAIGCIDPTPLGVITGLIRIAFGVMGGVALVQLILAGVAYQSGKEDQIQKAREKVIATITGVALLVFSVLILRIIGINVLDVVPTGSF